MASTTPADVIDGVGGGGGSGGEAISVGRYDAGAKGKTGVSQRSRPDVGTPPAAAAAAAAVTAAATAAFGKSCWKMSRILFFYSFSIIFFYMFVSSFQTSRISCNSVTADSIRWRYQRSENASAAKFVRIEMF